MFRINRVIAIMSIALLAIGSIHCGGGGSSNNKPLVDAGANQGGIIEGQVVFFAGSYSDIDTTDTHTLEWDFGDGTAAVMNTLTPSHAFPDDGDFTVTLTVNDSSGGAGADTLTVTVANADPTADAGTAPAGDEGESLDFAGSASDPGTGDILTYEWDFGDGSAAVSGTLTPSYIYSDNGDYLVTLTVQDDDGASVFDTIMVIVDNVAPTVEAGPDQGSVLEGQTLDFSGSFTDPGSDSHTIEWDFGDGSSAISELHLHRRRNLHGDADRHRR